MLATISQLFRKMYNPRNFKGSGPQLALAFVEWRRSIASHPRIVSPHEFYQAVGRVTQKKSMAWSPIRKTCFGEAVWAQVLCQADGSCRILLLAGTSVRLHLPAGLKLGGKLRLMGYLHKKSRDKKGDSLIHDVFQGEVQADIPKSCTLAVELET